ncbi:MAG: MltA domain-containing protein [Alphaproteobacteria bacterium]|nr:MltA domain-containing protein [Alphaproteobacteria bacterium]
MLFGAGAALCIVLIAAALAALFSPAQHFVQPDPIGTASAPSAPAARYVAARFSELAGWGDDTVAEVLVAWRRCCWWMLEKPLNTPFGPPAPGGRAARGVAGVAGDWAGICQALGRLPDGDDEAVRNFVEETMTPIAVARVLAETDETDFLGLFTGYYEPVFKGARTRGGPYTIPLFGPPADLVGVNLGRFDPHLRGRRIVGRIEEAGLVPYATRGEIEAGALNDTVEPIFWLADALDAYILHVQGSGRIDLPDGNQTRAGFAAHNGHAYQSIGRWLVDQGELVPGSASFDAIRGWMETNADRVAELMAVNPRFVFFREVPGQGPIGAAGVPLAARRSLAVDPEAMPLGVPVWLDADPVGVAADGTVASDNRVQRLMMAQDTGGAIKGAVRGDFFWGSGEGAGRIAGRMSSRGRYYLLLPNAVAAALVEGGG